MIVLPGPAFIVIPLGVAILATVFVWAIALLKKVKEKISRRQIAEAQSSILFNRSAFVITETELKVIAALAMTGLRSIPKKG